MQSSSEDRIFEFCLHSMTTMTSEFCVQETGRLKKSFTERKLHVRNGHEHIDLVEDDLLEDEWWWYTDVYFELDHSYIFYSRWYCQKITVVQQWPYIYIIIKIDVRRSAPIYVWGQIKPTCSAALCLYCICTRTFSCVVCYFDCSYHIIKIYIYLWDNIYRE